MRVGRQHTTMRLLNLLTMSALLYGACLGADNQFPAGFPERKTFQFGEFTIEASAGDEAYVEALAVKLADYRLPAPTVPAPDRLTLDDLARKREYFLNRVAGFLGMDRPTDKMASTYGSFLKLIENLRDAAPRDIPRHYSLWRKPELLARLDRGEKLEGFSKDPSGELNFSFNFNFTSDSGDLSGGSASGRVTEFWNRLVCPIKIGLETDKTPADEVSTGLDATAKNLITGFRDALISTERLEIFTVLHEATESGVVWHYLTSKDRRWFCDGVANYVAWKVIEAEIGAEAAKGYYDLAAELKKYESEAARVDLAAWPAAENMEQAKYAENLNTANYAFATKVIADICAKHGDGLLPKLFKEIGRTPPEKATMETVYRAFKRQTGDNLRFYLPKPAAKR